MNRLSLLLAKLGSLTDSRLRIALNMDKLTPRHAMVLTYLESEPACQQVLNDLLDCDPSVVVTILNELERSELIYRRRDPSDRRRHIVEITPDGSRALKGLETTFDKVEDELFAGLSQVERATLRKLLSRITSAHAKDEPAEQLAHEQSATTKKTSQPGIR